MDKARINKLYDKLEKLGVFDEVNTLLWEFTTGAAHSAYAEGKADGYKDGVKDGYTNGKHDGYTNGKHDGYEMAIARLTRDAQEF